MNYRYCEYCGDEIPLDRNMNSKYCCNECYYENKKDNAVILTQVAAKKAEIVANIDFHDF